MVKLDCSAVLFYSPGDERALFERAVAIPGVLRWEQDTLVVRGRRLSASSLSELLALFFRYGIPMQQLRAFLERRNEHWFSDPKAFWHEQVFGRQPPVSRDIFVRARRNGARAREAVSRRGDKARDVHVTATSLVVDLLDGRSLSVPLTWFPRLLKATPAQRANWKPSGGGFGIHWPDIDEDLSVEGLLRGAPAPRSGSSVR